MTNPSESHLITPSLRTPLLLVRECVVVDPIDTRQLSAVVFGSDLSHIPEYVPILLLIREIVVVDPLTERQLAGVVLDTDLSHRPAYVPILLLVGEVVVVSSPGREPRETLAMRGIHGRLSSVFLRSSLRRPPPESSTQ